MTEEQLAALTPVGPLPAGAREQLGAAPKASTTRLSTSITAMRTRGERRMVALGREDAAALGLRRALSRIPGPRHETLQTVELESEREHPVVPRAHARSGAAPRAHPHARAAPREVVVGGRAAGRRARCEFADVDAEVIDRNVIRLDTRNVLEVDADARRRARSIRDRPVRVIWNGVARELRLADGALRLADPGVPAGAGSSKTAATAGRACSDFTTTPFAVVIGTSAKDPAMAQALREKADAFVDAVAQLAEIPAARVHGHEDHRRPTSADIRCCCSAAPTRTGSPRRFGLEAATAGHEGCGDRRRPRISGAGRRGADDLPESAQCAALRLGGRGQLERRRCSSRTCRPRTCPSGIS